MTRLAMLMEAETICTVQCEMCGFYMSVNVPMPEHPHRYDPKETAAKKLRAEGWVAWGNMKASGRTIALCPKCHERTRPL